MGIKENNEFICKRKLFRVYLNEPICIEISIVNFNGKSVKTNLTSVCVNDIGVGGLRFSSNLELPVGKNIVYQFKIPLLNKCYHIKGNIVWKTKEKDSKIYYGASFLIDDKDISDYFATLNTLALAIKRNRLNSEWNFCNIKKCPNKCL